MVGNQLGIPQGLIFHAERERERVRTCPEDSRLKPVQAKQELGEQLTHRPSGKKPAEFKAFLAKRTLELSRLVEFEALSTNQWNSKLSQRP